MITVAEIKDAVEKLPDQEYKTFLEWFEHFEEEKWDKELESHVYAGKLDALGEKALADFKKGKYKRL